MSSSPIGPEARARLRNEQAAEAAALKRLHRTQGARLVQEQRLTSAEAKVSEAIVDLVRVSGAWRAARLADEPVRAVRQIARDAGLSPGEIG
jgi:hypothetical protein